MNNLGVWIDTSGQPQTASATKTMLSVGPSNLDNQAPILKFNKHQQSKPYDLLLTIEKFLMTKIACTYTGDGQTVLQHGDNYVEITTDLPVDNGGKGRYFSPTDLFASSLASCAVTIMGKMAESHGKSISGTQVEVEKIMGATPRRVAKIMLKLTFPETVDAKDKEKYLASINACPVHNSLSKDVEIEITSN